jgi:hypothetical protein
MKSRGPTKKERVIHSRVPESLDEEIKRKATGLGLSVSNLVRNVLENSIGLVEDIVHDSTQVARSARGEPTGSPAVRHPHGQRGSTVLGWQVAILNVNAICERCNAILPKGSKAAIGVIEGTGLRPFRCESCLTAGNEPGVNESEE